MRKFFIILSVLALCSCDHFEEDKQAVATQASKDAKTIQGNVSKNTMRVADNVRDSIKRTGEHMRDWWITPLPSNAKQPMPPRYCYRVLQDILCYRQPMPGWETKLVAYQGAGAPPPPQATMKLMPLREDSNAPADVQKKVENMKPVFVSMPPDVKAQPNQQLSPVDAAHETLPDNILSPQL